MSLANTVLLCCSLAFLNSTVLAKGMTFGIVAKSIDDANFIDAWQGCNDTAKRFGDKCVLIGPKGDAQLRLQAEAVSAAIDSKKFDAFAISVISSKLIARALKEVKVPVITFDSPFTEKYKHLSLAYVGTNNIEFGKDLANITKQLLPEGGSICFMTAMHELNLSSRLHGARLAFSNNKLDLSQRLKKDSKWTELSRCPWNTSDNINRAHNQLAYTLKTMKPDVFISVGHWPIVNILAYKKIIEPFSQNIMNNKPLIIIGIGSKSMPEVSKLMDEGLVHGFVSIDFLAIGKKSYQLMKGLVQEKIHQEHIRANYIGNIIKIRKP